GDVGWVVDDVDETPEALLKLLAADGDEAGWRTRPTWGEHEQEALHVVQRFDRVVLDARTIEDDEPAALENLVRPRAETYRARINHSVMLRIALVLVALLVLTVITVILGKRHA